TSHTNGDLLWDAGLSEDMATAASESDAFKLWLNRPLSDELADAGVSIADIDYFAMSHSHFDHSGNAPLLLDATWIASSAEIAFTKSEFGATMGVSEVFNIPESTKLREITEDHDVFGDGSVTLIQTPGHTGGHMALLIKLEEAGPLLLSGDLYHYQESRNQQLVPTFNYDALQTRQSMEKFEALAKELGAKVVIQHSKAEFDTFPRPPEFLK
ncbi:MAG: N-acyl homoserine lactonase family protein, partial [Pseudomonadota bacterium]